MLSYPLFEAAFRKRCCNCRNTSVLGPFMLVTVGHRMYAIVRYRVYALSHYSVINPTHQDEQGRLCFRWADCIPRVKNRIVRVGGHDPHKASMLDWKGRKLRQDGNASRMGLYMQNEYRYMLGYVTDSSKIGPFDRTCSIYRDSDQDFSPYASCTPLK
jgi:hypothetical protein